MSKVIIAGDLCPHSRVARLFDEGRYSEVLSEVKPIVEEADYAMVNLEAPIVSGAASPIKKSGPNLKCTSKVIDAIKYVGFNGVSLANNHFYDYGEDGALNTIKLLSDNGIDYVGGGKNSDESGKVLFKDINGQRIAFVNCCEHEFSISTDYSAGSNPLDIINQYCSIQEAKRHAQFVIVIVHGGIEMYQLPTPRMVKAYHFFVDVGADAVINHHQHCYSGYEYYQGKPIIYGLGNFCFDWEGKRNGLWNEGYMVRLIINNETIDIDPIPYVQCNEKPSVLLSAIDKSLFEQRIGRLSNVIVDNNRLSEEYRTFLNETWKNYDIFRLCSNPYIGWLFKKGVIPSLIPRKRLISILNAIRCESHNERLVDSLIRDTK